MLLVMMTQLVVVTQLVAMTQLVVVVEAGYLYDQHAPAPLPWAASARGGILKTNKTTKKDDLCRKFCQNHQVSHTHRSVTIL